MKAVAIILIVVGVAIVIWGAFGLSLARHFWSVMDETTLALINRMLTSG